MATLRYTPPPPGSLPRRYLIVASGEAPEGRFPFYERLQIGRKSEAEPPPGHLQVADPTVSSRHCIVTQAPDGSCRVRDVSRNGTRLDGRRLVPNIEAEFHPGQVLTIGQSTELVLDGRGGIPDTMAPEAFGGTLLSATPTTVTVLVGDIRDYSVLVRECVSTTVQQSVSRVFGVLSDEVGRLGGTVKEYQGDAIFAFWEPTRDREPAVSACRAAVALDGLVRRIAADRGVWDVPDFPLHMDWALATGPVVIDSFGGSRPAALSMVGAPVVLAFRIEKFADAQTGPIVVCAETRERAAEEFEFIDLGPKEVKGFDRPQPVFALVAPPSSDP